MHESPQSFRECGLDGRKSLPTILTNPSSLWNRTGTSTLRPSLVPPMMSDVLNTFFAVRFSNSSVEIAIFILLQFQGHLHAYRGLCFELTDEFRNPLFWIERRLVEDGSQTAGLSHLGPWIKIFCEFGSQMSPFHILQLVVDVAFHRASLRRGRGLNFFANFTGELAEGFVRKSSDP
jgi:hypothetical protein